MEAMVATLLSPPPPPVYCSRVLDEDLLGLGVRLGFYLVFSSLALLFILGIDFRPQVWALGAITFPAVVSFHYKAKDESFSTFNRLAANNAVQVLVYAAAISAIGATLQVATEDAESHHNEAQKVDFLPAFLIGVANWGKFVEVMPAIIISYSASLFWFLVNPSGYKLTTQEADACGDIYDFEFVKIAVHPPVKAIGLSTSIIIGFWEWVLAFGLLIYLSYVVTRKNRTQLKRTNFKKSVESHDIEMSPMGIDSDLAAQDAKIKAEEEQSELDQQRYFYIAKWFFLLSRVLCLIAVPFAVASVEAPIYWNAMSGRGHLGDTLGQTMPLFVGGLLMLQSFYFIFVEWYKGGLKRFWELQRLDARWPKKISAGLVAEDGDLEPSDTESARVAVPVDHTDVGVKV